MMTTRAWSRSTLVRTSAANSPGEISTGSPSSLRYRRQILALKQGIEDHAGRPQLRDGLEDLARRLLELEFRGIQHREFPVAIDFAGVGDDFDDLDAVQRPTMRERARVQFLARFRERDVEGPFAERDTLEKKLQRQCGLAGAGIPSTK